MNSTIDDLLVNAIDMHVHGSPDVVPRKLSDLGLARAAMAARFRGIMVKSHMTPTTSRAALVQEALDRGIEVFGGVVLNQWQGGLNPAIVESELALGAKEVWLPTQSSVADVTQRKRSSGKRIPVPLTDENGSYFPALIEILDLIAQKDVILGTGHISSEEIEKIVCLAKSRGVKKVLITHPEGTLPGMSLETQKRLAKQGVWFERCFYSCNPPKNLPPSAIAEQIRGTGVEMSVMATDFGQVSNDEPVVGLRRYVKAMLELGISERQIEIMIKHNPAQLLGLEQRGSNIA